MQPYPLRVLKNLNRLREIATVLLNHGFGDLVDRLGLRPYLDWGRRVVSRRPPEDIERLTTAVRLRLALQALGPTFIKFGQLLSTRPDLIPPDVICELKQLQEHVPPFPVALAHQTLLREFGLPAEELFGRFDEVPLAAGSLAQVHRATSREGTELAIKIRRPDITRVIENDLSLMVELAQLMERHLPESRVFDPVGLVNHFTRTIRREMNFRREARTMQEFTRQFNGDPAVHVPVVEEELCSEAVLTMEYIDGIKVDDLPAIRAAGLDPPLLARLGARIFLRQALEMGIFHGDPHPGNMRFLPDGSIALLDYGMVGYLDEVKRDLLIDLFLCVVKNNLDRAVDLLQELGQPTQPVNHLLLQADLRDFMEAYYGLSLEQLRVGPMLNEMIAIMSNHGLRCPGDLMLLVRAIVSLEGVGRQLDPKFNLAEVLAPFVERMIRRRYHPKRIAERAIDDLRGLISAAHDLPLHLGRTLQKVSQDDLKVQLEHRGLDHLITEFDRSSNRVVVGLVTSSLVVATALVLRGGSPQSMWIALPAFILSGLLGVWLVWGILRSGRL